MRIDTSSISEQPKLSAIHAATSSVNRAESPQRIKLAQDSYTKNAASAQIIDAEYVESYTPDTIALQQKHQTLHLTQEPVMTASKEKPETNQQINSVISKYLMTPIDAPPPGTYLNIFA